MELTAFLIFKVVMLSCFDDVCIYEFFMDLENALKKISCCGFVFSRFGKGSFSSLAIWKLVSPMGQIVINSPSRAVIVQ